MDAIVTSPASPLQRDPVVKFEVGSIGLAWRGAIIGASEGMLSEKFVGDAVWERVSLPLS